MKLNVDQALRTFSGEELADKETKKPFSLKWAFTEALLAHNPQEHIDGNEKFSRFKLAHKIDQGGEIELTVDELAKLKNLIGMNFAALIVGQVWQLLESPG